MEKWLRFFSQKIPMQIALPSSNDQSFQQQPFRHEEDSFEEDQEDRVSSVYDDRHIHDTLPIDKSNDKYE